MQSEPLSLAVASNSTSSSHAGSCGDAVNEATASCAQTQLVFSVKTQQTRSFSDQLTKVEKSQLGNVARAVFSNLPYEFSKVPEVPCLDKAVWHGMLVGGVVSAFSLWRTKSFRAFHHGMLAFACGAVLSWQYCRMEIKYSFDEGMEAMLKLQQQQQHKQ